MVDATFSTISMVISSKFLESTSLQFVQLVEALMVSFGMASKLFWVSIFFFVCLFFDVGFFFFRFVLLEAKFDWWVWLNYEDLVDS